MSASTRVPISDLEGQIIKLTVIGPLDIYFAVDVCGEVKRIRDDHDTVWVGSFRCPPTFEVRPCNNGKEGFYIMHIRNTQDA